MPAPLALLSHRANRNAIADTMPIPLPYALGPGPSERLLAIAFGAAATLSPLSSPTSQVAKRRQFLAPGD
jgi:hypothetical protein